MSMPTYLHVNITYEKLILENNKGAWKRFYAR